MKILTNNLYIEFAEKFLNAARRQAMLSTCLRSKCGSVIVTPDHNDIIGSGFNSPPGNVCPQTCIKNTLPSDFKSDRTCCMHAEQRAIMDAMNIPGSKRYLRDSTIYFVRLDESGDIKPSGDPYCTICSKMCLDAGIKYFVMKTAEGIIQYTTEEFNELSFKHISK